MQIMKVKLLSILIVTAILVTSFVSTSVPVASALTQRTDFSDRHTTASRGYSNICGDHVCAPGEKTQWLNRMSSLQREGVGKINQGETYQEVLQHLQTTSNSGSGHMPVKMTEKVRMNGNMTSMENATQHK